MLRDHLADLVRAAVSSLIDSGGLSDAARTVDFEIQDTKQPEHGDYACNFALVAAKPLSMNPRQIAELLRDELLAPTAYRGAKQMEAEGDPQHPHIERPFQEIEVAGPGFLNFKLDPTFIASYVGEVLGLGNALPNTQHRNTSPPKHLNVEFVSVNPNGPITVGSGRGAAFGDTLCRVFEAAGHMPYREFYVNDGVNSEQMRLFAESVLAHAAGRKLPEGGYKGDYVGGIATALEERHGQATLASKSAEFSSLAWFQYESQHAMMRQQKLDLQLFGVDFDRWFSEQSMHDEGKVDAAIQKLIDRGDAYWADKPADEDEDPREELAREQSEHPTPQSAPAGNADLRSASGGEAADFGRPEVGVPSEAPVQGKALWLRSSKYGDDKDRVIKRADGRWTYIASDIAYLEDKLTRNVEQAPALDSGGTSDSAGGQHPTPNTQHPTPKKGFDKAYMILGPDHHGYIGRMHAVYQALGYPMTSEAEHSKLQTPNSKLQTPERLEIVIFQIVRFMKEGKPAPMRKRDGNIYELRDLIAELGKAVAPNDKSEPYPDIPNLTVEQARIGRDVARYFYLMRSHETHMDFDIDLATKQSDENPVFYAQYAHARICSVLRKAEEVLGVRSWVLGDEPKHPTPDTQHLRHPKELALIKKIVDLPWEVRRCAEDYGVHRLTTYATELAKAYHLFYDACRVIQPEELELTQARLALCEAARIAFRATFDLLGISAPERMERDSIAE